jgi:hypothetical protein
MGNQQLNKSWFSFGFVEAVSHVVLSICWRLVPNPAWGFFFLDDSMFIFDVHVFML